MSFLRELEVPNIKILLYALLVNGLRDNDYSPLNIPTQGHLGRRTCRTCSRSSLKTGWVKMPNLPSAKGPQASGTTPYSFISAKASSCWKKG